MEHTDLNGTPFDELHLQWFGEGEGAGEAGGEAAGEGEGEGEGEGAGAAEPELKADGTFLAQAPDRYKRDQKYLKDLLKHKSWGEVLDRLYASEAKVPEIPEKPEEYEFDEIAYPEELAGDELKEYRETLGAYIKGVVEEWRKVAHELGVGKEAAKRVGSFFAEKVFGQVKAAREQQQQLQETGLQALKEEWKGFFAEREELAKRAVQTFGGDALVETMTRMGLENDPGLIKAFYEIGRAIGEDTLVPSKGKAEPGPEEKKAQALRQRYANSPELHKPGEGPAPAPTATLEKLEELKGRYPSMGRGT